MKKIYFTLIEKDNKVSPNIGTISVDLDDKSMGDAEQELQAKAIAALGTHFDADIKLPKHPNLLRAQNYDPIDIDIDIADGDYDSKIQVSQTYLY